VIETKEVKSYEAPVKIKKLIEDKKWEWSILKRINHYVQWIPRIVYEKDLNTARKYFGGFYGDILTYMTINGFDDDKINEARFKLSAIQQILSSSNNVDYNTMTVFFNEYKNLVKLLTDYGMYFAVRLEEPKSNDDIVKIIKNLIRYIDELERDLLSGYDVKDEMSKALEKLHLLISQYYSDDRKICFIRDTVAKRIKKLKAKVGSVKKEKSAEHFADAYSAMLDDVFNFISVAQNPELVDKWHGFYAKKEYSKDVKEMKEEQIIEMINKALVENPEFGNAFWNFIKAKIEEEGDIS